MRSRIIVAAAVLAVCAGGMAQEITPLAIGEPAPDFDLPAVGGGHYSLDSFSDAKVLMVVFTANHCPTAQAYEGKLKQLREEYDPEELQLVAISSNHPRAVCLEELGYSDLGDSFEDMKIRAEDQSFTFPYLYDGDEQVVARAYGAQATPHVFIFGEDRRLRYTGRVDDTEDPYKVPRQADARNAIEALLAGEDVPVKTTKAFGCSMKWKSKIAWRNTLDEKWAAREVELREVEEEGIKRIMANEGDTYRLVNFWATWCGPCVIEFPELVEMQRMYGRRDFEVVTVSTDNMSSKEDVLEFLEEHEAAMANYIYAPGDIYELIDLVDPEWQGTLPHTLILAPGGKVIYRHSGIIDPLEVRRMVIGKLGRYYAND